MKRSFGHVGGYLQGHPLMRVETSHTRPGIIKSCCWVTGLSSIRISIMLKGAGEAIKSKGDRKSLFLIRGTEKKWKLEPRYTAL